LRNAEAKRLSRSHDSGHLFVSEPSWSLECSSARLPHFDLRRCKTSLVGQSAGLLVQGRRFDSSKNSKNPRLKVTFEHIELRRKLPQQTRYAVSPQKGSTAVTMAHFFGPVGSTASGAGKGLVTRTKNSYVQMEGKTVQLQHSRTEDIETVAGPKAGSCAKQWSCPKNCGFSTKHPPALTRHLQAGKCKPLQKVIDGDTSPGNQTGPPAGCSSSAASEGTARSSRVAAASGGTADDVGQALPTEEARVGQKRKKDGTLKTSGIREGEKRKVYSIFYRYAVVLKCNKFKEKGDKTPTDSTATIFGVHKSCVSKWNKQADQLRQALQSPDRQMPGHVYHVSDEHPSAKRILLGREPASF